MPYKDPETRRLKQRAYSKRHYEANKETIIEKTKPVKLRNKEKWAAYKKTLSCVFCGYNDHPAALDFHHVEKSKENRKVHKLAANDAWRILWKEIQKCIVLCSNCHRHLHNSVEFENAVLEKIGHQFKAVRRVHK